MELPTILIIASAVSSAKELAKLCQPHTQSDTRANYYFAKPGKNGTWHVFNPESKLTKTVPINGLNQYDLIVVTDEGEFKFLHRTKIGESPELKSPVIWTGTHIHADEWELFETWIKGPTPLRAIDAVLDLR